MADSDAFDVHEEDFPERVPEDRRMFILLQQKDGSWREVEDPPSLPGSTNGGMRGDPYHGSFMEPGYLLVKVGWGSSSGSVETWIYEYQGGSLTHVKTTRVSDYSYAEGYDVQAEDVQTGAWRHCVIAMDGYRMVRVDLEDSMHPAHKAFPEIDLFDRSYYIYRDGLTTQTTAQEALDRVRRLRGIRQYGRRFRMRSGRRRDMSCLWAWHSRIITMCYQRRSIFIMMISGEKRTMEYYIIF